MSDTSSILYQAGQLVSQKIANTASTFPSVSSASQKIQDASGSYGSVKVTSTKNGYAGYAIQDDWVFMSNGAGLCGIYNDTDNQWGTIWRQNGATDLYHNGAKKLQTTSQGVFVTGTLTASSFSGTVGYADSAGNAGTLDSLDSTHFLNYNNLTNKPSIPSVSSSSQYILTATGNYGTVKVNDNRGNTWAGYAIRDDWVLMSNGSAEVGLYNDTDNEWAIKCWRNAQVNLYHNGALRVGTTTAGISVSGAVAVGTGEITSTGKGRFGGWGSYSSFGGAALEVGVNSNEGWMLPYNRSSSEYLAKLNLQCGNNKFLMEKSSYTRNWGDGLELGTWSDQAPTLRLYPSNIGGESVINTGYGSSLTIQANYANAMEIDTSGRIRMPAMPMVLMKKTAHMTATGYIVCDTMVNGISAGSYSTSNGRYTAPRTGRYVCSISVLPYGFNDTNTSTLNWYINGSHKAFAGMYTRMDGKYYGQGNTLTFYLNQGDYIQVYFNRNGTCGLHSNYTFFSAAYIG
jgi:hypothetical protein